MRRQITLAFQFGAELVFGSRDHPLLQTEEHRLAGLFYALIF
jgi:hypothetical protein